MKKFVTLLLAVTMVFALAVGVSAADVATGINTNWTVEGDIVTVTVSAVNLASFSSMRQGINYNSGLTLLHTDKVTPATASSTEADVIDYVNSKFAAFPAKSAKVTVGTRIVNNFSATDVAQYVDATAKTDLYKLYFKKNSVEVNDTTFSNYYAATTQTYYQNGTTTKYKSNAAGNFGYTYVAPVVTNPFSATVAGTTITCAGRVDAASTNYGVIFTAESTVNGDRAQKYYGAMNGDTVAANKEATSTTVFNFDGWDGTFEIILENVSAGSKTLDFFVNDTVIADTNFTVVVE